MAKSSGVLGISIRHGKLSLATMKGGDIQKMMWEEIPDNIVDDYKILTQNLFSEFLKEKLKENKIKLKKAAVVISDADIFIRNISMPSMDDDQLRLNIPFEFRDYIQGELKDYMFDFVKRKNSDNAENSGIELIAFAIPKELIKFLNDTLRLAGLKLEYAIPETLVYETILKRLESEEEINKERCFMDIGNSHIRMRVFKNGGYKLSHVIDIGERHIIQALADELNVDMHLAMTYLRKNFEGCQDLPAAVNAYKDISLEILKGLNYYEMSDMSSRLKDVVLCGSGAMIEPLVNILKERIDKSVITMQEMFPQHSDEADLNVTFSAVGVLRSEALGTGNAAEIRQVAGRSETNWFVAIPATIAILIAAGVISKFAVVDRFAALERANSEESTLAEQLLAHQEIIKNSEEITKEFYHYTWTGMTEEEKDRVSRLEVAELVDFIGNQGMEVKSFDLKDTTLSVNVTGDSLESISKLTELLNEQEIIESCSVISAKTIENGDATEVQLIGTDMMSGTETDTIESSSAENNDEGLVIDGTDEENAEGAEKSETGYSVDAQISIYLMTNTQIAEEKGNES